jgi:hypothetical protein
MGDGKLLTPRVCHHEVKGLSLLESKHVNKTRSAEHTASAGIDIFPACFSSHLQKHEIGFAGIFYVMTRDGRDERDIVGVVIHSARVSDRHKDCHAGLARDVELPLRSIGVPVQLPHTSWFDGYQGGSNIFRRWKIAGVLAIGRGSQFRNKHRNTVTR